MPSKSIYRRARSSWAERERTQRARRAASWERMKAQAAARTKPKGAPHV